MQNKQECLYKCPNHAANLNDMRLKDKYCDVTIKVDGKEIRAHKVILAANLKYFETMFSNDSFQESQDGVITMKSVEKADLELFVSYAYTGEIVLTDSNAFNLLELANYLNEDDIKKACIEFLEKNLKVKEACRGYKFAANIDCLSLKNAAKAKIIANFGDFSENPDYLNFESENLMDILSDGKAQSIELQKMFFEAIMKWIMHDAKDRKIYLEGLLSSINVAKLRAGDVTNCLYKNLLQCNDKYGITQDAIIYYEATKIELKKQEQVLIIISEDVSFQFYNFTENKWFLLQKIAGATGNIYESSAVLSHKLYYISHDVGGEHLQVFDPSSKQITNLQSWSSILGYPVLCACSKFLYICGGAKQDNSKSDQILRYDPQKHSLRTLTPMRTKRSNAAAIFHQSCLHVLGGSDGSNNLQLVEKYDPIRNEWTASAPMCEKRRGHAVAILDGKMYVCGGHPENKSVEVYDSTTNRWRLVASMNKARSYFIVVAHEGKLLAIGGEKEKTVEAYDPVEDHWQMDHEMSSGLQASYCAGGFFPLSACISNT